MQPHPPAAKGARFQHRHPYARAEIKGLTVTDAPAGTHQALCLGDQAAGFGGHGALQHQGQGGQQQKFHLAARGPRAQQPRLQHAGIVGHQQSAGGQQIRQVRKARVRQLHCARTRQHHEPRGSPLFRGELGNTLLGQIKIITFQPEIGFLNGHVPGLVAVPPPDLSAPDGEARV